MIAERRSVQRAQRRLRDGARARRRERAKHEPKDRSAEAIRAWLDEMEGYAKRVIGNAQTRRKGGQSQGLRERSAGRLLANVRKYRVKYNVAKYLGRPEPNFDWIERTIVEVRKEAEVLASHMRKAERGGV